VADNVAVTAGSASYTAATDDCTTGQVPLVKLAYSADGDRTHIAADANGLEVQGAGVAGTPAGGVVTIQGVSGGTVVPISDGSGSITVDGLVTATGPEAVDSAFSANPLVTGGVASTATPSAVSADGDVQALWVTRNGALMVQMVPSTTATLANVAGATASTTLQAANTARFGLQIVNDSTAVLYVKFGAAAASTSYTVQLQAGESWVMPPAYRYTGIVTGIWDSATGNARVTEMTA
jgi:hypothetical protein